MKIVLKTAFSPFSGYGDDGIAMALALLRMGHDVRLMPTGIQPPLPREVSDLLTKGLDAPFDLLLAHVDPAQLYIGDSERLASAQTVGWTMWEYTSLDNCDMPLDKIEQRTRLFDNLIGYDKITVQALSECTGRPVSRLQGGYNSEDWPFVERDWHSEAFRFVMIGALHDRKDPWVAMEAFRELKEERPEFESAELHLKTNVQTLHPKIEQWIPKCRVHYDSWDRSTLREFMAGCHVLLAPSRGEGKNLPALQFMSSGGTVIATNWGGHEEWLRDDIAYPLRFSLCKVDAVHSAQNARADKEHLKELMWEVFTDRAGARRKAETAARTIPIQCSWDSVLVNLFRQLRETAAPILQL